MPSFPSNLPFVTVLSFGEPVLKTFGIGIFHSLIRQITLFLVCSSNQISNLWLQSSWNGIEQHILNFGNMNLESFNPYAKWKHPSIPDLNFYFVCQTATNIHWNWKSSGTDQASAPLEACNLLNWDFYSGIKIIFLLEFRKFLHDIFSYLWLLHLQFFALCFFQYICIVQIVT